MTFIELLIVVIIIGILAGVSIPRFKKTFDNFVLGGFTKDIYYLLKYLQGSAVGEGNIYCLNINPENQELQAAYLEDDQLKELKGRFGKKYAPPKGIYFRAEPAEKRVIYFYPDAGIDKIKLIFNNQQKKISLTIEGILGEIKIQ